MAVTWTETSRHRRTTLTVTVCGAPDLTLGPATIHPEYVTFWLDGDTPVAAGVEGTIVKGKESKSGGRMATTWGLTEAPLWVRELAKDIG
jgi:hypothetical protein